MAEIAMKDDLRKSLDKFFGGHGPQEIGDAIYYACSRKNTLHKYGKSPAAEAARARAEEKRKKNLESPPKTGEKVAAPSTSATPTAKRWEVRTTTSPTVRKAARLAKKSG